MSDNLIEIYVETPNHWQWPSEQIWAKKIGDELYEIRSIPYAAYGLHRGDIVTTVYSEEKKIPKILEIHKSSGHQTVRVIFTNQKMPPEEREKLMEEFKNLDCDFEKVNENYYVLDAPTNESHGTLCSSLARLQEGGILAYETCEIRVKGSFGDSPQNG